MQSSSRSQTFKLALAGASPATDANCSQGVISPARRSAKAEVRGANPRESASFKAPVPQQLQGEFRKLVFAGASPTRGSNFNGDHDVTAASRPVKAFVPVRIRLVTPIYNFEPVRSLSSSSLEWFCISLVQFAVRFRN